MQVFEFDVSLYLTAKHGGDLDELLPAVSMTCISNVWNGRKLPLPQQIPSPTFSTPNPTAPGVRTRNAHPSSRLTGCGGDVAESHPAVCRKEGPDEGGCSHLHGRPQLSGYSDRRPQTSCQRQPVHPVGCKPGAQEGGGNRRQVVALLQPGTRPNSRDICSLLHISS